LIHHIEGVPDGGSAFGEFPAIGKGIGRDIEDPHDHSVILKVDSAGSD
jgi:hypothetical protein